MSKNKLNNLHFKANIQKVSNEVGENEVVAIPAVENNAPEVPETTTTTTVPVDTPIVNNAEEDVISRLADEVERGLHGSGRERMLSLGTKYTKVQQEVNRRIRSNK